MPPAPAQPQDGRRHAREGGVDDEHPGALPNAIIGEEAELAHDHDGSGTEQEEDRIRDGLLDAARAV